MLTKKEVENSLKNVINVVLENMNKMDLRIALCNHPNPSRIIVDNFSDVYKWNADESEYWNIIVFLEVVRQNNLWDRLEKLL